MAASALSAHQVKYGLATGERFRRRIVGLVRSFVRNAKPKRELPGQFNAGTLRPVLSIILFLWRTSTCKEASGRCVVISKQRSNLGFLLRR